MASMFMRACEVGYDPNGVHRSCRYGHPGRHSAASWCVGAPIRSSASGKAARANHTAPQPAVLHRHDPRTIATAFLCRDAPVIHRGTFLTRLGDRTMQGFIRAIARLAVMGLVMAAVLVGALFAG